MQILQSQFKEDTGRQLCDSGGHPQYDEHGNYVGSTNGYGRSFERLKNRDLDEMKSCILSFKYGSVDYTKSAYHFLSELLDYDQEMDATFDRMVELSDMAENLFDTTWRAHEYTEADFRKAITAEAERHVTDTRPLADIDKLYAFLKDECGRNWMALIESFGPWLELLGHDVGEGLGSYNTYNGECCLDTTLQWTTLVIDDTAYVLLQTHNGCDVRGGYSRPRIYTGEIDSLYCHSYGTIYCTKDSNHAWTTDDGYNWYYQGSTADAEDKNLRDYEMLTIDELLEDVGRWPDDEVRKEAQSYQDAINKGDRQVRQMIKLKPEREAQLLAEHTKNLETYRAKIFAILQDQISDVLIVDDDGNGYCPLCGGLLQGAP